MANKFQKSVMVRTELEQQMEQPQAKEPPRRPSQEPREPLREVQNLPLPNIPKRKAMPDLSEYLRPTPQRIAKNKTFYLDSDVIDAVRNTAKQQKVTDSKLVNDILRRVLELN